MHACSCARYTAAQYARPVKPVICVPLCHIPQLRHYWFACSASAALDRAISDCKRARHPCLCHSPSILTLTPLAGRTESCKRLSRCADELQVLSSAF